MPNIKKFKFKEVVPMNTKTKFLLVCTIVADRRRKKLLIPEATHEALNNQNYDTAEIYITYKLRYPNYEEEIIPNLKPIPLNSNFIRKGVFL
jgi:hypothetical protein